MGWRGSRGLRPVDVAGSMPSGNSGGIRGNWGRILGGDLLGLETLILRGLRRGGRKKKKKKGGEGKVGAEFGNGQIF